MADQFNVMQFYPDLYAKQLALQRQQALAAQLQKQALTPLESGQYTPPNAMGSLAIPVSPLAGLGKVGEAYAARQMLQDNDQKAVALAQGLQQHVTGANDQTAPQDVTGDPTNSPTPLAGNLSNVPPSPQSSGPVPPPPGETPDLGNASNLSQVPMPPLPGASPSPQALAAGLKGGQSSDPLSMLTQGMPGGDTPANRLALMMNPDIANKARFDAMMPTNEVKNLPYAPQIAGAKGMEAGATAAAQAPYGAPVTVTTAEGTTTMRPDQFQSAAGMGASAGGAGTTPSASTAPGIPTLSKTEEAEGSKGGYALRTEIDNNAQTALRVKTDLGEMKNLVQNFNPGSANQLKDPMAAWARSMGVPEDTVNKYLGIDFKGEGALQAFQKNTADLASAALKQVSARPAASEFMIFLKNNPNAFMTPEGLKNVVDFMDKTSDIPLQKQQQFQNYISADGKTIRPATQWENFNSVWNKNVAQDIAAGKYTSGNPATSSVKTAADINNQFNHSSIPKGQKYTAPDGTIRIKR